MEKQIKILQRLGLTEYQSKVFAALLVRSESTAPELAKISGVPVTKIYSILKSLEDMGFLKSSLSRPKVYRPIDVQNVVDSVLVKKQEKINDVISQRDIMISSLDKLYNMHGKKFETPENMIWLVHGAEASIIEIMKLVKSAKRDISFLTTRDIILAGSSNIELMNLWVDSVLNRNINFREIEPRLNKEEKGWIINTLLKSFKSKKEKREFLKIQNKYFSKYFVKEIPKNKEIHFSMIIRDSNAVCLLLNHPLYSIAPYGLVIYDEKIVKGFLDYFNSLWDVSKSLRRVWLDTIRKIQNKL